MSKIKEGFVRKGGINNSQETPKPKLKPPSQNKIKMDKDIKDLLKILFFNKEGKLSGTQQNIEKKEYIFFNLNYINEKINGSLAYYKLNKKRKDFKLEKIIRYRNNKKLTSDKYLKNIEQEIFCER